MTQETERLIREYQLAKGALNRADEICAQLYQASEGARKIAADANERSHQARRAMLKAIDCDLVMLP